MSRKIYSCLSHVHIGNSSFNKWAERETPFLTEPKWKKVWEHKLLFKSTAVAQVASEAYLIPKHHQWKPKQYRLNVLWLVACLQIYTNEPTFLNAVDIWNHAFRKRKPTGLFTCIDVTWVIWERILSTWTKSTHPYFNNREQELNQLSHCKYWRVQEALTSIPRTL